MSTFELKMEGIEELENDIKAAIEKSPKELKKGLDKIGNDFRKSARKRTPDYKKHKGDPKKKLKRRYGKWTFVEDDKTGITIYNDAPHYHLVEQGHNLVKNGQIIGFVPGKHMMEQTRNEYENIVPDRFEEIIDNILKECDLD
jgi:hypothetical protein